MRQGIFDGDKNPNSLAGTKSEANKVTMEIIMTTYDLFIMDDRKRVKEVIARHPGKPSAIHTTACQT